MNRTILEEKAMGFVINRNTVIVGGGTKPVMNAVRILRRDIEKRFCESGVEGGRIELIADESLAAESFVIDVGDTCRISASDELGHIYGLLYISGEFLGIKPFWFWMDQKIDRCAALEIKEGRYNSPVPSVRYRGWFVNDEVLIMKWSIGGNSVEPWRMVFEALLRCGGNLVIPGTDKNSKIYRSVAAEYGLWITHHHAEPLGAEMFSRVYPELEPNYFEQQQRFTGLWEDAVREQKDMKIIWSLGFRGQGDCPFWSSDSSGRYDTPEKQGALISDIIELQKGIVKKYVKDSVFCTNLYGEVTELYEGGYISMTDDIIKICADNGYGKMVARRRDNHNARISSLPSKNMEHSGIYYHVSFYDLQAANHITMLPNSVDFVNRELDSVISRGADDLWLINCSNVKPHVYFLDAIRKKWFGRAVSDETHSREFSSEYYGGDEGAALCLREYHNAMAQYGGEEDEHCGEQFSNENVRTIASCYIRNEINGTGKLRWLTGDKPLGKQTEIFSSICERGQQKMNEYLSLCESVYDKLSGDTKQLFGSSILLQANIHALCMSGAALFGKAYKAAEEKDYLKAFILLGRTAELYERAQKIMRASEYGVWEGFYYNECFADIKHTAYMVRKMMGVVRELGDNTRHDKWYRLAVYAPEDRNIMTLLVNDNHMTDEELYKAFERKGTVI